jgi:acyl carrier protein
VQAEEIHQKLVEIVRSVFANDDLVVTPETVSSDVDGWDSLAHVRLMLTVEREFGIKFSAYEVNRLKNVGVLQKLVESKLKK